MKPMKIGISIVGVLVLIGTGLLGRVAAESVERALFSTVIQYWLNGRRRKIRSTHSSS